MKPGKSAVSRWGQSGKLDLCIRQIKTLVTRAKYYVSTPGAFMMIKLREEKNLPVMVVHFQFTDFPWHPSHSQYLAQADSKYATKNALGQFVCSAANWFYCVIPGHLSKKSLSCKGKGIFESLYRGFSKTCHRKWLLLIVKFTGWPGSGCRSPDNWGSFGKAAYDVHCRAYQIMSLEGKNNFRIAVSRTFDQKLGLELRYFVYLRYKVNNTIYLFSGLPAAQILFP